MELYQEILCHVFANEKIQVSFPELVHTDVTKIVELECYKALAKVKAIIENDALADSSSSVIREVSRSKRLFSGTPFV